MTGAIPPALFAKVILIMAGRCLVFVAPFLVAAALWRLVSETDRIIAYFFPDLEWEHNLGWLNIRAERRANAALRWLGYGIYLLLAAALLGIVWGAEGLPQLGDSSDPWVLGDLALRISVLALCVGAWVLYLGGWLRPKLRAQREEAELKKFRAEMAEIEREREKQPRSRVQSPLQKPRTNAPLQPAAPPVTFAPDRTKRRRSPGE